MHFLHTVPAHRVPIRSQKQFYKQLHEGSCPLQWVALWSGSILTLCQKLRLWHWKSMVKSLPYGMAKTPSNFSKARNRFHVLHLQQLTGINCICRTLNVRKQWVVILAKLFFPGFFENRRQVNKNPEYFNIWFPQSLFMISYKSSDFPTASGQWYHSQQFSYNLH